MPSAFHFGLDLGGTKMAAVVLDEAGGTLWEQRQPTPRGDYDATLAAIVTMVGGAEAALGGPCTVGLGIPGALSRATGLVKNANSTWLNGRPLQQDLERRLRRPVRLANDANCLAASEAADGAAAGAEVVFAVILGTGAGGGLVAHGRILTGANAIAGEWGHNPLPWPRADEWPGPPCYCGRTGCAETFVSGTGLAADYVRRGGLPLTGERIVERATAGEALAEETLAAWDHRLARALASIINIVDPDVIVVGGGLSCLPRIYDHVPRLWLPWVFSDTVTTALRPARHGDASGVRGAARLWATGPAA